MTSSYYKLNVENRPITGKKTAKKLRNKGIIPGGLYYKGEEPIQIAVDKLGMYMFLFHSLINFNYLFIN